MDRALFLRAQPYFSDLDASILATIATYSEERFLRPGEWLQQEGAEVRRLALLAEGEVSLLRGGETLKRISSPGGVGIIASLADARWTPGVVAIRPTVYLDLSIRDFFQILEDRFPFVLQIVRVLARERPEQVVRAERPRDVLVEPGLIGNIVVARRNPLFADMNLIALVELLRTATEIPLGPGSLELPSEGRGDAISLLVDGRMSAGPSSDAVALAPGDVVGLDAVFGAGSGATWVARSPGRLLQIPRARYLDVLEDHFPAARALLRHLARRTMDAWRSAADPV
jgi:CRP-like cAMP-binding protein